MLCYSNGTDNNYTKSRKHKPRANPTMKFCDESPTLAPPAPSVFTLLLQRPLYCPPTVSSGSLPCWLIEHGLTSPPTQYRLSGRQFYTSRSNQVLKENKKAQLLLTNPHDAKACQNCSNSTCLQRCRWQYGYIFICLAFVASEMCEIPRNSLKIQTYRVQGHPRSSILVPIKSA